MGLGHPLGAAQRSGTRDGTERESQQPMSGFGAIRLHQAENEA
jgi:hypothetical protein